MTYHTEMTKRSFPGAGFRKKSDGSVSVELLLILPLLLWALTATVVFFEGFRARYQTQMAAQTVADIMSRETSMFTANYVEGMNQVFDFLAGANYPTRIRVSSVIWDSANNRNRLQWSYGSRGMTALPANTFHLLQSGQIDTLRAAFGNDDSFTFAASDAQMPVESLPSQIPPILPGESLIVIETFALWSPFADVGVGQLRFNPVVAVRPRFSPWVNFEGVSPIFPESSYEIAWAPSQQQQQADAIADTADQVQAGMIGAIMNGSVNLSSYDFSSGADGWSNMSVTYDAELGAIAGPFDSSSYGTPPSYTLDVAPGTNLIQTTFDLIVFDNWDGRTPGASRPMGDAIQIFANGDPINFDWFDESAAGQYLHSRSAQAVYGQTVYQLEMKLATANLNIAGNQNYDDQIWQVTIYAYNPPPSLTLSFSSTSLEAADNESFGIDNFFVNEITNGAAIAFASMAVENGGFDAITRYPSFDGCPDFNLSAPRFTVTNENLKPSVMSFVAQASGTNNLRNCAETAAFWGSTLANPNFIINFDNNGRTGAGNRLMIEASDGNNGLTCDTLLLVRDPNGQYWHNDDTDPRASLYNPQLRMNAAKGNYHVWVGYMPQGPAARSTSR
ncbi:MAG: hypothetical protein R3D60_13520 [Paracoccaceae bacterium]